MGPAAWSPSSDRPAQAEDFATGTVRGGRVRNLRFSLTRPPKAATLSRGERGSRRLTSLAAMCRDDPASPVRLSPRARHAPKPSKKREAAAYSWDYWRWRALRAALDERADANHPRAACLLRALRAVSRSRPRLLVAPRPLQGSHTRYSSGVTSPRGSRPQNDSVTSRSPRSSRATRATDQPRAVFRVRAVRQCRAARRRLQ